MNRVLIVFVSILFFSSSLFALVDYTDEDSAPSIQTPSKRTVKVNKRSMGRVRSGGKSTFLNRVSFDSSIDVMKVSYGEKESKINKYNLNMFVQTGYNVFLSADYWYASSDSNDIAPKTSSVQSGNPLLKMGFNWLRFGKSEDLATIDIYGGLMFKGERSDFASGRIDKIAGAETTKRFIDLAIGIGYETRLTGSAENGDRNVGNINKLSIALGWRVSNDINISLKGVTAKVSGSDEESDGSLLRSGFSFGYVSPKIALRLSRYVGLDLFALFRTNKIGINDEIVEAKLWDIEGLHGNSIGAGLRIDL